MDIPEPIQDVEHAEIFRAAGTTMDVTYARIAAWEALRSVLGSDPVAAWRLGRMAYGLAEINTEDGTEFGVRWEAEFARTG